MLNLALKAGSSKQGNDFLASVAWNCVMAKNLVIDEKENQEPGYRRKGKSKLIELASVYSHSTAMII
jgi:hypothetical protein